MKAFKNSAEREFGELASSFSLTEKLAGDFLRKAGITNHDEHNQTGILTFGLGLASAFPTVMSVALEVCSPLQWRNRRRVSRRSLVI
jgi:hypothetical protein